MNTLTMKPQPVREALADVHCYLCGHTVKASVLLDRKRATVKAGEKCGRCGSELGAAIILRLAQAA